MNKINPLTVIWVLEGEKEEIPLEGEEQTKME